MYVMYTSTIILCENYHVQVRTCDAYGFKIYTQLHQEHESTIFVFFFQLIINIIVLGRHNNFLPDLFSCVWEIVTKSMQEEVLLIYAHICLLFFTSLLSEEIFLLQLNIYEI